MRLFNGEKKVNPKSTQHSEPKTCVECGGKKWFQQRLYQLVMVTVLVLVISYFIPVLKPVFNAWIDYFSLIWWALLLGFALGGVIDFLVPEKYIQKHLALTQKTTIFKAVALGFLMSACSHGILAIAMELYKKGASTASTIAFLLASPWANLPITIILFGFFGFNAVIIILSAILVALVTGLVFQLLESQNIIESHESKPEKLDFSVRNDLKKRIQKIEWNYKNIKKSVVRILKGSWNLTKMVLWWVLIGILLASFVRAFVPTEFFHQFLGPSLLGLALTLFFATIIEVCSEGSAPLAFEIFNQTKALGNSYVFLMAGVVTDYTEIGLIWSNIGKKAALWLIIVSVPQVLLLGFLFNVFL